MSFFSRVARWGRSERPNPWIALPMQAIILALLFSFISISLTEGLFFIALVIWAIRVLKRKERIAFPRFFVPLMIYAGLSIVASAFSVNPVVSFIDARDLAIFLLVPLIYNAFTERKPIAWANRAVLASAAVSILYSFYQLGFTAGPGERIRGFLGHYMTQAGMLALFCALALAMAAFLKRRERFAWAIGFAAGAAALVPTMTRSAWIGLVAAAVVVLLFYKPKWLIALPVAAALLFFVAPRSVKNRALTIVDPDAYSNRTRIEYARAGVQIIRNFPLLGTGPDTVDMEFQNPKYGLSSEARQNVHLHSNMIQIAAERGIPALLAWLAFMGWALVDLLKLRRQVTDDYARAAVIAGLASVVVLFLAGLFEYNFGDSEITMLFMYLITVPFSFIRAKQYQLI